jgi:hypothetical protein
MSRVAVGDLLFGDGREGGALEVDAADGSVHGFGDPDICGERESLQHPAARIAWQAPKFPFKSSPLQNCHRAASRSQGLGGSKRCSVLNRLLTLPELDQVIEEGSQKTSTKFESSST